jgi:hypothetical protein
VTTLDRDRLELLVSRVDLDGLVRLVDAVSDAGDWAGLECVAEVTRSATRTGRQLWPVTSLAEYRLALLAPGEWAAKVLVEGKGQFAIGPLSEVAASTHTWDALAPWLERGPLAAFVAHERVVRGEDLTGVDGIDPRVLDLPLVLQSWEPAYPVAEYGPSEMAFPAPAHRAPIPVALASRGERVDDRDVVDALRDLAGVWVRDSNGRADVAAVAGDHLAAVAALGVPSARVAEVGAAEAMAWMAWTAASGGAHGRRPGMARGRFGAWWAAANLAGLGDAWPVGGDELGEAVSELRWFWWDAHEPVTGWRLGLAVWDPADGLAWAITATDEV